MATKVVRPWTILLLLAACGPKQGAEQPAPAAATSETPPATEPAATESAAPESAASDAPASDAPAQSDEPQSTLRGLCDRVCKVVATKCSKAVAQDCELHCLTYDKTPQACEPHAAAALRCYETAKDLPCANMAPESCRKAFRTLSDCQRAPDSFQVKPEEKKKLPEGWGIYEETAFSVPAPGGITKSSVGQETTWTATAGNVRYTVRKLPVPKEKLTAKSQLRLANQWLKPCTLKMKLHGHVEKADRSSLLYASSCKDGGVREGQIHVTADATYIVGIEAPAGEKAELETFVYGFTLK